MLKVGIIGFGFMGRMHYAGWEKVEGATVTAVCDANPKIVKDAKKATGNIAGVQNDIDFNSFDLYADLDAMLRDGQLEAVSLTVPTYLHASCSIAALEAGVHVLCEKPMALDLADCQRMLDAADRSGKTLQIGHCIRFWPEYAKTKKIIDSGEYGKVVAASFRRLASTAVSKAGSWFASETQSGGMALDLHIHDTDFVHHLFGMPHAVSSFAAQGIGEGMSHMVTRYDYGDEKIVTAESGWVMMPTFGFEMSFRIALEKATIVYDHDRKPTFRLCPAEGEEFTPELEEGDGYSLEIANFAKMIHGEKAERIITPQQARDSIKIVEAEKASAQSGKTVFIA